MPTDKNPSGKIPALIDDDGNAIYDSAVICAFVDAKAANKHHPEAPLLWRALTLQATVSGILDAAILIVYEHRVRPEELQFPAWIDGQRSKIDRGLDAIETNWIDHLNGPVNVGSIAVGCMCGYFDFRPLFDGWRGNRPKLAAWYDDFSKRPSMMATQPNE
jgi:glutathione S-transferase